MERKILANLESTINAMGLEALMDRTGQINGIFSIEHPNKIGQLGVLHWEFQNYFKYYTLRLKVNKKEVAKAHIDFDDSDGYYNFVNTIKKELQVLLVEVA